MSHLGTQFEVLSREFWRKPRRNLWIYSGNDGTVNPFALVDVTNTLSGSYQLPTSRVLRRNERYNRPVSTGEPKDTKMTQSAAGAPRSYGLAAAGDCCRKP